MYQFEASSLGYSYCTVEEDSGKGACCNMRVNFSKPGVLKSKIPEGIMNENSTASCKESRKGLVIRDLKAVHVGRGRLNLLDFFYSGKANIRIQ